MGVVMGVTEVEAVVDGVPRVDDRDEAEDEDEDDDAHDAVNDSPRCLGHPRIPPNKRPLEVPGPREDRLEP